MAGLLDLPSEVILIIVEYLQSQSHDKGVLIPFYWFGDAYRETVFEHDQPPKVKDLHSLLLTSRQFKSLLQPILYRDIFIRNYTRWNEKRPFDQLQWSLENIPSVQNLIVTAMIPCVEPSTMYDVSDLFWFPNLKDLTIHHFKDWEELEFEDNAHVATSVVEHLRLISCGAHEEALAAVLSWPKALKTLFYDVEQGEWDAHYEDQPVKEWTCEAFVRTLQPQKETLEELVMARPRLEHEGLYNGPAIQLRDFSALKVLRIYHIFLCGWDGPDGISTRLPPNLEVLEVWYDDTQLKKFLVEQHDEPPYDRFLEILVRDKKIHFPKLHKVTVFTDEHIYDRENDEELGAGLWELPTTLAHDAVEAGIEINVWLGCEHYPYQPLQEFDVFRSLEISQTSHATSTVMLRHK
ncbi:hypothetical protein N7481_007999 [Penicillium waksmanii]|uniref:uncharacterized protein n=1 Tax=Penicillium waksmanii TaxID=69791 RepID=UPI002547083A|nr:uncharacterized protein N7481_007999 [Penicillium waksmanii]KAJ5980701.1 hypothetical protein N7481_007999 [Penicillium waksmanii]